jgi:hypothetical protein
MHPLRRASEDANSGAPRMQRPSSSDTTPNGKGRAFNSGKTVLSPAPPLVRADEKQLKEFWLIQMSKKDDEIKAAKHSLTRIAERRKVCVHSTLFVLPLPGCTLSPLCSSSQLPRVWDTCR